MHTMVRIPVYLLQLSLLKRMSIFMLCFCFCLLVYSVTFPSTTWGGLFIIPVACAGWFFGLTAGLLWMLVLTLLLYGWYCLSLGSAFWTSPWVVPFIVGTCAGALCVVIIGVLRSMTQTLLKTQKHLATVREAYEYEQQLNHLKDDAFLMLSHEVRNPLTQVQGFLDLLEDAQEGMNADQTFFLLQAKQGCEELLRLLTTMLDTVPSSSRRVVQRRELLLQQEVMVLLAHIDPRQLMRYCVKVDIPGDIHVQGDAQCLQQILRNLLSNVFKYTPDRTQVTIRAFAQPQDEHRPGLPEKICIQVCDQGPGIAPDRQLLIFERFVRLDDEREVDQSGAGLGLFICKQLVEAMGGTIWVESTGVPGEGCRFSFTLEPVVVTTHE